MQFALHYMGQTEGRLRRFLHEVSRHLRVGGVFIATTMDSRVLMQLLMGHAEQSWVRKKRRPGGFRSGFSGACCAALGFGLEWPSAKRLCSVSRSKLR